MLWYLKCDWKLNSLRVADEQPGTLLSLVIWPLTMTHGFDVCGFQPSREPILSLGGMLVNK